ncbi:RNase H family protein [Nocardia sp. NPDC088792]|uniref:RNase H family protein n=1 Tax=Nocardia sp. NPDC088792 TaxID=3364332 RepID=UPI003803B33F
MATDGSWKANIGGHAYVTYNGHWGIGGRRMRGPLNPIANGHVGALVQELRAIGAVLEDFPGRRVRFLVDSVDAIDYLRAWQAGEIDRMPPGYDLRPRLKGGREPALMRFAGLVCGRTDLRFVHVAGHRGHRMNDVADRLASLGRRACSGQVGNEVEVAEIASTIVTAYVLVTRGTVTSDHHPAEDGAA